MATSFDEINYSTLSINLDEVHTFLEGVSYPATKREILDIAYDNGAPDHILEFINDLADQEYYSETDLGFALEDLQTAAIS